MLCGLFTGKPPSQAGGDPAEEAAHEATRCEAQSEPRRGTFGGGGRGAPAAAAARCPGAGGGGGPHDGGAAFSPDL